MRNTYRLAINPLKYISPFYDFHSDAKIKLSDEIRIYTSFCIYEV